MTKLSGNGWLVGPADRVDIGDVKVYRHSQSTNRQGKNGPSRIVLHTVEGHSRSAAAMAKTFFAHENPPHFWMATREIGNQKYKHNAQNGSRYRVGMDKSSGGFDKVLQRLPLEYNARALKHPPNTPETNYMGRACVQIEIEGYAGDAHRWNDETLESIGLLVGKIAVWIRDTYEPDFRVIQYQDEGAVTYAYGVKGPRSGWARMTPEEWRTGRKRVLDTPWTLCGHQNVPDNVHWDPGGLKFKKVADIANAYLDNTEAATVKTPPVSPPPAPPTVRIEAELPTNVDEPKDFPEVARLHRQIALHHNYLATEYERLCL